MKLNELKPKEGSTKNRIRVGRGIGSGKGKTSGSGHKGQHARSGVALAGFEGGQMPIERRLPKFGFSNKAFGTELSELTTGKLQAAIDSKQLDITQVIDEKALLKARVVRHKRDGIKLLSKGVLTAKVNLKLTKASKTAQAAVEKAGGSVTLIVKEVAPVVRKKKI